MTQRIIKFRAWTDDGMVEDYISLITVTDGYTVKERMCVAKAVMQFTGLSDKNGKEIYEGDLIQFERCEGVWPDQIGVHEVGWLFNCGNSFLGEVIGNIYENPELIN